MKKKTPRKLSTTLGTYFVVSIFFLCGLILCWTYYSTSKTISLEIKKTFEQKYSITENIFERETERIDSILYEIQLNKKLLADISRHQTPQAQKIFEKYVDKSARNKCDVIFITKVDEPVWLNASSPVPNVKPVLDKVAAQSRKFLTTAKIVRFKNKNTDLTGIFKSKKIILDNGDVMGIVIAGTILNDNLLLLNNIKHQTKSPIVIFLDGNNIIASPIIKGSEKFKVIVKHSIQGDLHHGKIPSENGTPDLMLTHYKMEFYGAATPVNIIFSMNDNMLVKLKKLYIETLIIIATLFTIFLFLTLYIVRRLIYPSIERMLGYTERIAREGTHEIVLEQGSIVELNIIGSAMEKMIASINKSQSKMKASEKALRESEKKYKTLFEKTSDAIFIVNKKTGRYLDANASALKLTGRNWSELRQLTTKDITPKGAEKRLQKLDESETIQDLGQTVYIRPDGVKRTTILIAIPLSKDTVIGIARDITEELVLHERLRQAQKMEAIGTLAGGIAHDFNNILFPILGHSEMLMEDTPEESPFREGINQIYAGAIRASELVKQILTFSRQESGDLKLMKIQPVIKEALKLIRSSIPTTIDIQQNINPDCGVIKADPTQLHQIVMNLATNAFHAMEENGGEMKIDLKKVELEESDLFNLDIQPGTYACLSISDTGTGMDNEVITKIFDPFFTTKGTGRGTGMGLSVVHGIVKNMNGAINVYSEPEKGTEFNVYLPLAEALKEQYATHVETSIQKGTEHILLVDDENSVAIVVQQMLERLGYQVTSYTSSIKALESFNASPDKFDIVITDMQMPNMSGGKLAIELTKIRPDIPILLCTGFSEIMSEEKAASMGVNGFLLKPIVMKDLSHKIRKVLDNN